MKFQHFVSILGHNRRLGRHRTLGATAVETAVALCLLLVMLLAGGWSLSHQTQRLFHQASHLHSVAAEPRTVAVAGPGRNKTVSGISSADEEPAFDWPSPILMVLLVIGSAAQVYLIARKFYRRRAPSENQDAIKNDLLATLPQGLFEKRQKLLRQLANLQQRQQLHVVRVKDVMSPKLFTVQPETPVTEVCKIMRECHIRHVLVCGKDEQLVGIISDRDIGHRAGMLARQIMTRSLVTAAPEMEVIPTITTMMNRGISALPIVEEGKLVGILTTTDIMLILQCTILLGHRDACGASEASRETTPYLPAAASLTPQVAASH